MRYSRSRSSRKSSMMVPSSYKRYRSTYRRRAPYAGRSLATSVANINTVSNQLRTGKAFPVSMLAELKWAHHTIINLPNTAAIHNYRFSVNSAYNPSGGPNPQNHVSAVGHSVFSTVYQKYQVTGVTLEILITAIDPKGSFMASVSFIAGVVDSPPNDGRGIGLRALPGSL